MSSPVLLTVLRLPLFLLSILPTISAPPLPPTEYDCQQSLPSASNPFPNRCGRFNATRDGLARRVVGGSDAYRGQLPWHADLDGCGGTIVSPFHVLTAAHCVQDDKGLVGSLVHVGHVLSIRRGFDECTRQTRRVENLQVHPCYCGDRKGCGDDIVELQYDAALVTVETPLYFNDFVQPACLPIFDSELTVGTWATVSGFGHVDYDTGEAPDNLQFVKKPIISAYDCKRKHNDPVTDDMLCAGFEEGGKDACVGDSGGPLVVVEEEEPVVVVGVVSWGVGCADKWPGVYSKVSHVVDWIEDAMKDVEDGERRKRRRRRRSVNETSKRGEARRGEGAIATEFNQAKCSEYLRKRSARVTSNMGTPPTYASPVTEVSGGTSGWRGENTTSLPLESSTSIANIISPSVGASYTSSSSFIIAQYSLAVRWKTSDERIYIYLATSFVVSLVF